MSKVHMKAPSGTDWIFLCGEGQGEDAFTENRDKVTCDLCLKDLATPVGKRQIDWAVKQKTQSYASGYRVRNCG